MHYCAYNAGKHIDSLVECSTRSNRHEECPARLYWGPSSCLYMAQLLIVLEILQKPLGSTLIVLEILQKPLGSTPYFLGRLREIESGKGTPFVHPTRYYYHRMHGNTGTTGLWHSLW